jgi:hypothetical protein
VFSGSQSYVTPAAGTTNTGGGGGGGGSGYNVGAADRAGGTGGSGAVIVRYTRSQVGG